MTPSVLEIRNAQKALGGQQILTGVDLGLAPGRVTALLGPSGAGKSTLLRTIAGLEKLDAGTISGSGTTWDDGKTFTQPQKRRVGVVFQDYALFPHLTVADNIAFGIRSWPPDDRQARIAELMAEVEIEALARSYPHELSGGEQQRVALVRALAPRPDIILLDEPFSSLDRRLRGELRQQTMRAIRESGAAALIVTHDADEAFETADELALMDGGRIAQTGSPVDVYLKPASLTCARLLGDLNAFPAKVENGAVQSPFGPLSTPGQAEGAIVRVLARPEAIAPSPDGVDCRVEQLVVRQGRLKATVAAPDASFWQCDLAMSAATKKGETLRLALNPEKISILPV
jgi:iron(III) transport system ATP-binding protein